MQDCVWLHMPTACDAMRWCSFLLAGLLTALHKFRRASVSTHALEEAPTLRLSLVCSKEFAFDINGPGERRRHVLSLVPVDWAAEWVRPTPPAVKFVGPILSAPGKPLPAELEVHLLLTPRHPSTPMGYCHAVCCPRAMLT